MFAAQPAYSAGTLVSHAARGVKNGGASAGATVHSGGTVFAPSSQAQTQAMQVVPEPSALALAGLGLLLLATVRPRPARR